MRTKVILTATVLSTIFAFRQSNDRIVLTELQCEYRTEPIGIDVSAPRFGWRLSDPKHVRGQVQTAYHIFVAGSFDKLTETKADVWNSGKIKSSQSVLAPYGGKKLQSSSAYFWKVRVYDRDGNSSEWTGLAEKEVSDIIAQL
jgi:alpha-L-rhamnosidase